MDLAEVDPVYFGPGSWRDRLNNWLEERSPEYKKFYLANASHIVESILNGEAALKMVPESTDKH